MTVRYSYRESQLCSRSGRARFGEASRSASVRDAPSSNTADLCAMRKRIMSSLAHDLTTHTKRPFTERWYHWPRAGSSPGVRVHVRTYVMPSARAVPKIDCKTFPLVRSTAVTASRFRKFCLTDDTGAQITWSF